MAHSPSGETRSRRGRPSTIEDDTRRSRELLALHEPKLIEHARRLLAHDPEARPVGLVLDVHAPEAEWLVEELHPIEQAGVAGFVGIIPREIALGMIRAQAPQALDFLEPNYVGTRRRLPLLAVLETGYRLAAVDLDR